MDPEKAWTKALELYRGMTARGMEASKAARAASHMVGPALCSQAIRERELGAEYTHPELPSGPDIDRMLMLLQLEGSV